MKRILYAFLLGLIAVSTFGQGIKGGLNLANIGGDATGVKQKIDFHVGIFFLKRQSDSFAVQPEIVYSRQGAEASDGDLKVNYDYLNIPVMFNIYPDKKKFYLQMGPQLGILVAAKFKSGDNSVDVKDELNTIDFSVGLGAGIDLEDVMVGVRYNIGLTTTAAESDGSYPNRVLQLSLNFKF